MKILIIIPTRPEDVWDATRTAELHKSRSRLDPTDSVDVKLMIDYEKIGWVAMINKTVRNNPDYDYYLYSCADYLPGKGYLYMALNDAKKGWKMVAFNDGKWQGRIATVALVEKNWMQKNYHGDMFYKGYKSHFADTELTILAISDKVMIYNPFAVLMEIDYDKEKKEPDVDDMHTFRKRLDLKFEKDITQDVIDNYRNSWQLKKE